MRHWEKSKKDSRRFEDPEQSPKNSDHKKKKLKPVEKMKYRTKAYGEDDEE